MIARTRELALQVHLVQKSEDSTTIRPFGSHVYARAPWITANRLRAYANVSHEIGESSFVPTPIIANCASVNTALPVKRTPHPEPTAVQHVCVDHSCANVRVPQQLLHRSNV